MVARGPDGFGEFWSDDGRCGFGHRRLSIIDLSDRAAQPMSSEDGRYVISFNGEIYNHRELRSELAQQDVRFRTTSDTEVILQLYARDGGDMVSRLRGMFALAIWDNLRRRLFLARDPYGIKPLYTANDGWTFRFASQVKALVSGGNISSDQEPAGVVGFHVFGSVPEPFTFWRDIRALPAGHTQIIDEFGAETPEPYFNLADILAGANRRRGDGARWLDDARAALTGSVGAHLVSDVEIGIFLSAGVDSGAILGLIRDCGRTGVPAVTLSFDEFRGTDEDEAPLAARVAELYGARHIVRHVSQREFSECLSGILDAMDQPSIDGVNSWFVARAAREAGLKVAISGLGGDELFAGYPGFTQVPKWHSYLGPFARIPGLGRFARAVLHGMAPGLERSRPKALGMLQYAGTLQGAYLLRRALNLPEHLAWLDRDLLREGLRRLHPLAMLKRCMEPDPGSDVARICALESVHYMRNQLLRDCDWAGMAHGVEIRLPLVDVVLLKAVAPFLSTLSAGRGKAALAAAPTRPLPAEVLRRAKTGFSVPTGNWLPAEIMPGTTGEAVKSKSASSRGWSQFVLSRMNAAAGALPT